MQSVFVCNPATAQSIWHYIHIIDKGVDSGPIFFEDRFAIESNLWVNERYELTYEKTIKLFENSLEDLIASGGTEIHYRKEINELKQLDVSSSENQLDLRIRATYMPGFPPPYFKIRNQKYLVVHAKEGHWWQIRSN